MVLRIVLFGLWIFALAGCAAASPNLPSSIGPGLPASSYPDLGAAPELTNSLWLNTPGPLRLADLRGKVILLDMWTFGCINCKNVIPSLQKWHSQFSEAGLVVIGNHYPEFTYEADLKNLKQAVADLGIAYPIAEDNSGKTWQAYGTIYWPTLYLIDKQGRLRYTHIGEGAYDATETAIRALLAEPNPHN